MRRDPIWTADTCPDGARTTFTAPAGTPSFRAIRVTSIETGPHWWWGERTSYGSSTARRYGMLPRAGHTSRTSAVRPPEVEKKKVVATCPLYVSTWFAVRATASFEFGVS